jgi:hypothetical protein
MTIVESISISATVHLTQRKGQFLLQELSLI